MTLIVEDGTGLQTAESYVTVATADAYHVARGNAAWGGLTLAAKEAALRNGTSYVDTIQRYNGFRLTQPQALEFPRQSCYDWSGFEATGVPMRVQHATCELALRAADGTLFADVARGGRIKSESVGPISTTYADDAPIGTWYTSAMRMLEPYSRASQPRMGGPGFVAPATDPQFAVGMTDYPPTAAPNQWGTP